MLDGVGLPLLGHAAALTPFHRSTVFRMLPMPAYIKDVDLVFTHANPAYCELVGLDADDIVGSRAAQVGLLDATWHEETDRKILAGGGVTTFPVNVRRPGGPAMRGEIFKIRLDDETGRAVGILGVFIDRTAQFETEQQLVESQTIHRLVVESISDAVFLLDHEHRFVFVGPAVTGVFGLAPREAMAHGTLCALLGCDSCELHSLRRDRETRNIERSFTRADGEVRDVLMTVKPIEIGACRWLVTCHDVTDRNDSLKRLKASMVQTVQALCTTVEQRDPYVTGHQDRVADLAVAIGRVMGMDEDRLEGLRLGAIVHDIGKINVPIQILSKPGKLSGPEFEIIRSHAEVGYQILKDIDFPWPIARMVREHHEAIDGSGYPLGLTGDQLLLESRIIAVADVLEAVTSHRPYRPGLGLTKGLEILREMRGAKLDPEVVDVCVSLIERQQMSVPGWVGAIGSD
ncbi:HD domain-containing phosphohydrolase [Thalassobaculum sp.]|uniref:HD domain-containing phosphohydrolase n=1 Tax=Thalassobaculum sp. TaxID=2022740 RepID=UPI0032EF5CB1